MSVGFPVCRDVVCLMNSTKWMKIFLQVQKILDCKQYKKWLFNGLTSFYDIMYFIGPNGHISPSWAIFGWTLKINCPKVFSWLLLVLHLNPALGGCYLVILVLDDLVGDKGGLSLNHMVIMKNRFDCEGSPLVMMNPLHRATQLGHAASVWLEMYRGKESPRIGEVAQFCAASIC